MDFKNAVKALQIGKKEGKKFRLSTEFGKNPEEELPFPEYPVSYTHLTLPTT